jgi:hypothetical protein
LRYKNSQVKHPLHHQAVVKIQKVVDCQEPICMLGPELRGSQHIESKQPCVSHFINFGQVHVHIHNIEVDGHICANVFEKVKQIWLAT